MKKTKLEKGITLIALIITIIVLLILAVVTIGAVQKSKIISHAQKAKNDYTTAQEKEQIQLALSEWAIVKNTGTKTFKSVITSALSDIATVMGEDDGPLTIIFKDTNNKYGVNATESDIAYKGELNILEKYLLIGSEGKEKYITDIIDFQSMKFLDDAETISNASSEMTLLAPCAEGESVLMYFKYKDEIYKFKTNMDTFVTDVNYGVISIYKEEESSRVGQYVKYDNKLWRILYDDDINGLQMVSEESLKYNGEDFLLGATDSLVLNWNELIEVADLNDDGDLNDLEKCVYSYNNAIITLNTACENIVTPSSNILDIRCVGSNPTNKNAENADMYTSEKLRILPMDNPTYPAGILDRILKSADTNYISDYERMLALEIHKGDYWLASRDIEERNDGVGMYIKYVSEEGYAQNEYGTIIIYANKHLQCGGNAGGPGLRPVITLKSDIQFSGSGTEADPYTF